MGHPNWSFAGYTFPIADSPARGGGGEWDSEEKLIEQDPLMANVTILSSWGEKSAHRTITGTCGQTTRDQMRALRKAMTVGILQDSEARTVTCRIVRADFDGIIPGVRYSYTIEFMER